MSADFDAALEQAIAHHQRRARMMLGIVVGLALLAVAFAVFVHGPLSALRPHVAMVVVAVGFVLLRNQSSGPLERLRGGEPLAWVPSPSHGLLVLTQTQVMAGGLQPLPLDRAAARRCDGAGYDDATHTLIVQELRPGRPNEGEVSSRHKIKLAPSVTPAQAVALSLRITQLTAG